jgi:hypothetical protein
MATRLFEVYAYLRMYQVWLIEYNQKKSSIANLHKYKICDKSHKFYTCVYFLTQMGSQKAHFLLCIEISMLLIYHGF